MLKKLLPILALVVAVSACNGGNNSVVAVVNGEKITQGELDDASRTRMLKIQSQIYDLQEGVLNEMVQDKLLEADAKKNGKTSEQMLSEVESKVQTSTEAEAKRLYQMQKKRFGDKEFEEVKETIMNYLDTQKKKMAIRSYMSKLYKDAQVDIKLERPRMEVSVDDDPSKGPKGAPITIIEFSEYQCPFCRKARPTIDRILKDYDGKVHYVFRDFPLGFHDNAKSAANAAQCAGDQKKYWEFNKELWKIQRDLTKENFMRIAGELKLNMDEFKKCVESNKFYAEIDKDQQDGLNAGVSGTPAYFINGVFLSGARPYSAFKAIIDAELENK